MTVELVQSIKDAEKKADAMIREARQKARQMVKEAEEHGARLVREAQEEAAAKAKAILQQAEAEARQEAGPLVAAQMQEITRLKQEAEGKLPEAVSMIKERVVKFHGHR